jgi:hypothetical protein
MWDDDRFKELSKPKPNGQTLWVYLLTGPHTNAFPGVFVSGEAAMAEALDWPFLPFRRIFKEILDSGMAQYDQKSRLVYLPKAVLHNPPQSPNVVKAWRKVYEQLPDCDLKFDLHHQTILNLRSLGFGEDFTKALGEALPKAFTKGSGKPFANQDSGFRIQDSGDRKQDSGFPCPPNGSKPSESPVPEEAAGESSEAAESKWQKHWDPIERHIAKSMTDDVFIAYYGGIEVRDMTKDKVVLAVPGTLVRWKGGIPDVTLDLWEKIRDCKMEFMRDRTLVVVNRDEEIA